MHYYECYWIKYKSMGLYLYKCKYKRQWMKFFLLLGCKLIHIEEMDENKSHILVNIE